MKIKCASLFAWFTKGRNQTTPVVQLYWYIDGLPVLPSNRFIKKTYWTCFVLPPKETKMVLLYERMSTAESR